MSVIISPPQLKKNYLDAAFHGILAALEAFSPAGPNIPNILSNLKAGFGAVQGAQEDSPGNRAWVWAFKTLSYATSEILKNEQKKAPLSEHQDQAVKEFLEAATKFEGQELDVLALINPSISPLFKNAQKALGPMLLKATTGHDLGLDNLDERFRKALRTGSNRTLCEDPSYFHVLEEAFTGLLGEGARRDGHWARHAHWISHQFTDAPIFSPNEEEIIPLEAIYLPLRCFWHKTQKIVQSNGAEKLHTTAHVADLHRTTHQWLSKDAKQNPILVVTGGPGSGKSSYARSFAHEVICQGNHRVLFIQLQHMTLTGSLYDDIVRYVDRRDTSIGKNGNPGFPGNPLDWRKTDQTPVVVIFDGLDELSTKEEDGERYARELLLALKMMLIPLNADGAPIRALVLGRNLACQAAMKTANIPLEYMLNVAPIASMGSETGLITFSESDIDDPDMLMEYDQRRDYWRKWALLKGLDSEIIPDAITDSSMRELNVEPLLLHLLIISKYSGDDWKIAADNKNVVYEDILQKIYERNRNKEHFQALGVTETLFFELMECLGIAAWRGNGRTGDEDDFRLIRKLHLDQERVFNNFPAANLRSVALNIHTRAGRDDVNGGFEFIHKSFGEYLAARGLLSQAIKTGILLEKKEPDDVEQSWSQLIGSAELSNEIIGFLYDEARRVLEIDIALKLKDTLTDLLNWSLMNGFSVHKIGPNLLWNELAQKQRCAVSALFASLSSIASTIPVGDWDDYEMDAPWTINSRWPASNDWGAKNSLTDFGVIEEMPIHTAMRRTNLARERLWDTSLSRVNFEGSDFRFSTLTWCLCIATNFENSNLKGVEASYVRLISASLKNCNLIGADLEQAYFRGVDMRQCNLSGANLNKVDASNNHKITFANWYTGLHVDGSVDLYEADLTGANLSDADLSGAVNLSLEAVNSANGSSETKLPSYIDRSKVVWLQ